MREVINEEVGVILVYSARQRVAMPRVIQWQNKEYKVEKVGYHHPVKVGQTLHHIFELADKDNQLWFRLNLDTSNLHWKLEAVSDGLST